MGVDMGTSGCKCVLLDEYGALLSEGYGEYDMQSDGKGGYTLEPDAVWQKLCEVVRLCSTRLKPGDSRLAIAACSCGESFFALNKDGRHLIPAMLCSDSRGGEQLGRLLNRLGRDRIMELTGLPAHEMYSIVKLMWLKEYEPHIFSDIRHVLQFTDYFYYKMTGETVTDCSMAARTMAFNVRARQWEPEILNAAEIPADFFPHALTSGSVIGRVRPDIAEELGIPADTLLVTGGHDQSATALGAGVTSPGTASDGMGSSECISAVLNNDGVLKNSEKRAKLAEGGYNCGFHAAKDKFLSLGFTFSAGTLVKWFCRQFAGEHLREASFRSQSIYRYLDDVCGDRPTGILIQPHFNGAGTPYMDTASKGAIIGLTASHTLPDIYRAVLEGISYEMLLNLERMEQAGVAVHSLRAVGGGAKSSRWLQLKADMFNRPIETVKYKETSALGAAICAGLGGGVYADEQEAIDRLVQVEEVYEPCEESAASYLEYYDIYKHLYPAISTLFSGRLISEKES